MRRASATNSRRWRRPADSITRLETTPEKTAKNFTGSTAVGDSWTDRLLAAKSRSAADDKPLPADTLQGVDESEWAVRRATLSDAGPVRA